MNVPIRVGLSPLLHIRGLLADADIKKGQVIERCPVILLDVRQQPILNQTVMKRYYYEWNARHNCLVLGHGSLYNHSFEPNVRYSCNYKAQLMVYTACRNITTGEELFINYLFDQTEPSELSEYFVDFDPHRTSR